MNNPTQWEGLEGRIANKEAKVCVVGMGYVGLPLSAALHSAGFQVIGLDTDQSKAEALTKGESYLKHIGERVFKELAQSDTFEATSDAERLGEADVIIVCVPTPLGPHQEPNLEYVQSTARTIGRCGRTSQLVILESTTYPGTTRDVFVPAMISAAKGRDLEPGENVWVAYSPEREDPGNSTHTTASIPKVVGGLDEVARRLACDLYGHVVDRVVSVSSIEVAEACKLFENIFRAVNIAMANEMKVVFQSMGIDVWEVIEAASTKPFGFMPFYPGPGLGGHCIPIDPFYLAWKAREQNCPTRFIELAGAVNTEMPSYVVRRLSEALNSVGKPVKDSNILILGLSYKRDVDDTRESPAFELISRIEAMGANVSYSDPLVPRARPVRRHDIHRESVELAEGSVGAWDAIVISTDHTNVDYSLIAREAKLVVDTRNVMRPYAAEMGDRLVMA